MVSGELRPTSQTETCLHFGFDVVRRLSGTFLERTSADHAVLCVSVILSAGFMLTDQTVFDSPL